MPFIGSAPNQTFQRTDGTRTGSEVWQEAKAAAVKIRADAHDTHDEDIGDALSALWLRDGGNQPTADLPMNGQKFTGVGNAAARTQFAAAGQVQDGSLTYAGTSSGTNTITATLSPAITAYVAGQRYHFKAGGTNTAAATINFNSVAAKDIKKGAAGATALEAGDITSGGSYSVIYDGTNMILENPGLAANVSAFMATVLDDASASAARTTLGLGTISTQASSNVSITGGSISGITDLPVADGGTGASTAAGARTNLGGVLSDAVFPGAIVAIIENRQTSGTGGGNFASGADRTVPLNTLAYNRNTMASLSSNQFTLPAGTWEISWTSPGYQVDAHQSLLRNVTAGSDVVRGTSAMNELAEQDVYSNESLGCTVVTIGSSTTFELRHRCQTTNADGFGNPSSLGTEIYARVVIRAA
jgi:hypothetical protein